MPSLAPTDAKQRATLAALMLPKAAEEARARQIAAGTANMTGNKSASVDANTDAANGTNKEDAGRAREVVGKIMNVSPKQVERAEQIRKANPEAFEKVKEGKSTVRAEHAKLPKKVQKQAEDTQLRAGLATVFKALNTFELGLQQLKLDITDIPNLDDRTRGEYLHSALQLQTAPQRPNQKITGEIKHGKFNSRSNGGRDDARTPQEPASGARLEAGSFVRGEGLQTQGLYHHC